MTTHTLYVCPGKHDTNCIYCDGGLALCTVCGGAEGSMPTDCPGVAMTHDQQDAVYAGKLDFKAGHWVTPFDAIAESKRILKEAGLE